MKTMAFKNSAGASPKESLYMSEPVSVVGLSVDDEIWRFLGLFAESTRLIQLRSRIADARGGFDQDSVLDNLGDPGPDICLVDFDRDRRAAAIIAERLRTALPQTAVFAVSSQTQPDAILEAMRAGCSEYLTKPIDREQLIKAVARIGARRREKQEQGRSQLLAFMGAKGGCGTTTLVTQFGALLSSSFGRSSILLDLHPDFGDAALYLKLTKTRFHLFELLENTERLDEDFLQSFVMKHSSGLHLIPAPEGSVSSRETLPPGALNHTLEFLRQRYEFIVADLPPSLNEENLTLIRECDYLYVITVAEVSAIRNVVRQMQYFAEKEIPKEKIRVVLNRHDKNNIVSDAQIEKALNHNIFWRVPNQYPEVVKTIHAGDPVSQLSNSGVARSLQEWAESVGKKPGTEAKREKSGGFLGFWNR